MQDASSIAAIAANQGPKQALGAGMMALSGKGHRMTDAQMNAVAKDFESMFISQMMGAMFSDDTLGDMFGDQQTKEVYRGMMMEEYGKKITEVGGIGIASFVKKELLALQEVQS